MTRLTAIILTYNEARNIVQCIESVRFADRVLVVDSLSSDETVTLAKAAGAEVVENAFKDYADQRNFALDAAAPHADWVLFIDADERTTPELAGAVRAAIERRDIAAYRIPRHNYIFGKLTRGAGWYPDHQTRLLRVGAARYDPARKVHEVVELDGALETLEAHLTHYNYDNVHQFHTKQRKYTAYEAEIMYNQGIRPKTRNFILQPLRHFRWRYITLKGYRDGWHGLRLSALMSWYEYRKYALLAKHWRKQNGAPTQAAP